MDFVQIQGYKSIKDATVHINSINLLIGGNGAGKSNFLSFFEFLNNLGKQNLREYISLKGGPEKVLYQGEGQQNTLSAKVSFDQKVNEYSFNIKRGNEGFVFTDEILWYNGDPWDITNYREEASVKMSKIFRASHIRRHLQSFLKYHFHDTGVNSPFNSSSHIENDSFFLYEKGENMAAYLYGIQQSSPIVYGRIIKMIQSVAPYFSDFYFQPNQQNLVRLQWQSKHSNFVYGVNDLSDGTIRFIALTVLFMQPQLPATLIIDEPELGLHPFAINKLAGMIQSAASKGTQVIVATQSIDLISYFQPEDILTVDLKEGATTFNRLQSRDLKEWLDEYAIGDLWKRNIIEGGQP